MSDEPSIAGAAAAGGDLAAALSWRPESPKFRLLAGVFLALFFAYDITDLAVAVSRGWPGGFGDSFALWSFGRFLREHAAAAIYDPAMLRSVQLTLGMDPGAIYSFPYPPSFLLVVWPLGQLPGWLACVALIVVTLPLYLWATLGRNWRSAALAAALLAPTTAIGIVSGQSGFLAGALLAAGLRLAATYPATAGVCFGLLSYKPQLGLLVPVALVAARLWRPLIAATLTAILLILLTSLLFGPSVWPVWITSLPAFSRQFAAESGEVRHFMPTILAALLQLGVAPAAAQLAQWVGTAAVAAVVWLLFRSAPLHIAGAGLLVAVFLATPYAFVYDMPILATAVIWVVTERHRTGDALGTDEVLVMILAMVAPITLVAGKSHFPLATLALILLLGAIVRRCHRLRPPAAAAQ